MWVSRGWAEENPGIYKLLLKSNIQIVICLLRPWFFLHVSQIKLTLEEIILLRKEGEFSSRSWSCTYHIIQQLRVCLHTLSLGKTTVNHILLFCCLHSIMLQEITWSLISRSAVQPTECKRDNKNFALEQNPFGVSDLIIQKRKWNFLLVSGLL